MSRTGPKKGLDDGRRSDKRLEKLSLLKPQNSSVNPFRMSLSMRIG